MFSEKVIHFFSTFKRNKITVRLLNTSTFLFLTKPYKVICLEQCLSTLKLY